MGVTADLIECRDDGNGAAGRDTMNLLTWNIQWGRGCDGRVDFSRIVDTAMSKSDADVLCFQEVARNYPGLPGSRGEDQFEELSKLLPDHACVEGIATDTLAPDGTRRQFGNVIFSRLPVIQVFRHLLPWPADPALAGMQRIAVEAVLQSGGRNFRVTTTHLEYYSARQRAAQVEKLRELHAEAASHNGDMPQPDQAGGPFETQPRPASGILTADFNFRPEDPLYERLAAPFGDGTPRYCDAWTLRHPGRAHDPTLGVFDHEQWPEKFCCDFIYVSEDLAPLVRDVRVHLETDASDHQPVLLALDL
jgi:endonuclease/exonuclease/phosphatase family metal-dependent hydrolase